MPNLRGPRDLSNQFHSLRDLPIAVVALVFSDKRKLVKMGIGRETETTAPMTQEEIDTAAKRLEVRIGLPASVVVGGQGTKKIAKAVERYLSKGAGRTAT